VRAESFDPTAYRMWSLKRWKLVLGPLTGIVFRSDSRHILVEEGQDVCAAVRVSGLCHVPK
jgi:hypothetical protein